MLIHIGKCGGSNLVYKFRELHDITIPHIHVRKPDIRDIQNSDHVCILIRNPINRYISIFYFYYEIYERNKTDSIMKEIFDIFPTAEELAINLFSNDNKKRELCLSAFKHILHLRCNHAFYLTPQVIDAMKSKRVFIIRQEHYNDDFRKYYDFLRCKYNINHDKYNNFIENKYNNTDKYNNKKTLSKISIENLKKIMSDDYLVLKKLKELDYIDDDYN